MWSWTRNAVEVLLHLGEGVVELGSALDAEVLVEERRVEHFDEAAALQPPDARGAVLEVLELEEQLVRPPSSPAAPLADSRKPSMRANTAASTASSPVP